MKTQHTPTPWQIHPAYVNDKPMLVPASENGESEFTAFSKKLSHGEKIVGELTMYSIPAGHPCVNTVGELEANAEFVLRAVNSHEELLEALDEALQALTCVCINGPVRNNCDCFGCEAGKVARAAIAKAKGEV